MNPLTNANVAKSDGFSVAPSDRAAVLDLVRAAMRDDAVALSVAAAHPRLHTPLTSGTALHLLGVWNATAAAEQFGSHPMTSAEYLDHVIDTADGLVRLDRPTSDERVRRLLRWWIDTPAGAGRSSVPATDAELTTLAVSLRQLLRASRVAEAGLRRQADDVAHRVALGDFEVPGPSFVIPDRGWTDGAATFVTLIRGRRSDGRFTADRFASASERAGLLIDIAFHLGAPDMRTMLDRRIDDIEFEPARTLLEAMASSPSEPLEHWIGRGPRLTDHLADEWARGHPRRTGPSGAVSDVGYIDQQARDRDVRRIERRFTAIAELPAPDPYDNAIAVVLATTGKLWTGSYRSSPQLLQACGPVTALAFLIQEFMVETHRLSYPSIVV